MNTAVIVDAGAEEAGADAMTDDPSQGQRNERSSRRNDQGYNKAFDFGIGTRDKTRSEPPGGPEASKSSPRASKSAQEPPRAAA